MQTFKTILAAGILFLLLGTGQHSFAQEKDQVTRILFLLDASGSMVNHFGRSGQTRMAIAKSTLVEILDSVKSQEHVLTGLRVYGHQSPPGRRDCEDTQLEVGFSRNSGSFIKGVLDNIRPNGITPIAYSLQKAGQDFPPYSGRNILILLTDGEESCGGDPCAVARELQSKGIVLKHFVIGIGMTDEAERSLNCMGSYFSAKEPADLKKTLTMIVNRVVSQTSVQINLLDENGKPTETDVNMTFYDSYTGVARRNIYHTMDHTGNPDTLYIDPVLNYNLTIQTIPPIHRKALEFKPGQHNMLNIPAPQGQLELLMQGKTINNNLNNKIKCLVRPKNGSETIHVQDFNTKEKYLTGGYELEFLTLPRKTFDDINISQDKTTTIQIPAPGIVTFIKKFELYGGIFVMENNKLVKIYDFKVDDKVETIALQPGTFKVIYRSKYSNSMHSTFEKEFEVTSGSSISLNL